MRQYAAEHNIPLYGSYDPECIEGLQETDFFDGLHCSGTGIERFFPGVPQVLEDLQNNTLPDPLAVQPRTSLETAAPEEGDTTDGADDNAAAEGSGTTKDDTTTQEG